MSDKSDGFLVKLFDIQKAISAEAWQSALALALTIPDICGKLIFAKDKELKDIDKYSQWYDMFVGDNGPPGFSGPKFTGEVCYRLRCAFLHSGTANLRVKFSDKFSITTNICTTFGVDTTITNGLKANQETKVRISIRDLCLWITSGAKVFYENNRDRYDFTDIDSVFAEDEIYRKYRNLNSF